MNPERHDELLISLLVVEVVHGVLLLAIGEECASGDDSGVSFVLRRTT